MRRMSDRSKTVLRVATLLWIVAVPVWSQDEPASEELGPDERRVLEIVQQVMESGEATNQDEAYEAVLSALATEFGKDHPLVLGMIEAMAVQLHQEGRYSKARQLFEQLVEVWAEVEGEDHPLTLSALNNLALVLSALGDFPKTLEIQRQVLGALSRIFGEEHPATLKAKTNLALTLYALGDLAGARTRKEEVLRARRRDLGEEHPDTLIAKGNLAGTLKALGDFAGARTHEEEVLGARRRILGEEHPDTLNAKANLAGTLYALGNLASARARYEEVVGALSRILGKEHPDTLDAKANLAVTLKALGNLTDARTRQEEVVGAFSRILGEDHLDTLKAKENLALTLDAMGDLAGARAREEEVLRALSRVLGEEHPDTLIVKANLAGTLYAVGDLAGARTRYEEVLDARSRILGEDHPDTLNAEANLALTLNALGDFTSARTRYEEVLDAQRRILGEEHPDTLNAKANLAGPLNAMGDFAGARTCVEEVLRARIRILGEEHPDTLVSLHNLAVSYERMGEMERARSSYEKIIRSHRKAQGEGYFPVTESEAKTLLGLGRVHRSTGRLDEAQDAFRLALDALEAQTRQLDLSEERQSRYRASFKDAYHSALAVAVERRDVVKGLLLSERYRARSLRALLQSIHLGSFPDIPVKTAEQLWGIAVEYDGITRTLDGLHPKRNQNEFRRLADRQTELRRQREVIQSEWLREQLKDRDSHPPLDLQGIQKQLDPGTSLLVYSVGSDQSHLFVLPWDGELMVIEIEIDRAALRRQVIRFHELLDPTDIENSRSHDHDRVARWFFDKLIKPAFQSLETADRWLILADGPLFSLPFGALVRPEQFPGTWHYLTQYMPVHTVQSAAVYAELRERRPIVTTVAESKSERPQWVGFGDPIYPVQIPKVARDNETSDIPVQIPEVIGANKAKHDGSRTLDLGIERNIFERLVELPYSEREILGISVLLPEASVRIHLGRQATEDRARSDISEARWIHFATHGIALPYEPKFAAEPMDSFLALSLFNEYELKRKRLKHNGLLQAWEIVDLKLNADLVVLSACQTAIGENRGGDGLISLSQAFQIAGARSVLASLWTINDLSTSEFMIRFYKHLLKGKTKDVALQDTQKEFIDGPIEIPDKDGNAVPHDFSHPYYWAAFQLIGDYQ